jgi:hypothetical protein
MVAARIAVVLVAALLPFAGAQLPQQTEITIQVTDVTGAVIPAARIQIDPAPSPLQSTFIADSQGEAAVDLPAGIFTLSIVAPGFKRRVRQINMQEPPTNRTITQALDIDPTPLGPVSFSFQIDIDLLRPPDPAPLPSIEIALLGPHLSPLPRMHWWRRIFAS